MTEKLGVLLVDVPEPKFWKYLYFEYSQGSYSIIGTDKRKDVITSAYKWKDKRGKENDKRNKNACDNDFRNHRDN